ncbi:MAG TPA: PGPGW domain-containing protein [Azospirillaceae bacterium]|nr:PGPGW domain-containing protein [Azospirillaceae bacterium]
MADGGSQAKRWGILIAGWGFLALGIPGLVLPILQGWLFIIIGLLLLSREYHWARQLLERLRRRFPRIAAKADQAADYVRAKFRHQ